MDQFGYFKTNPYGYTLPTSQPCKTDLLAWHTGKIVEVDSKYYFEDKVGTVTAPVRSGKGYLGDGVAYVVGNVTIPDSMLVNGSMSFWVLKGMATKEIFVDWYSSTGNRGYVYIPAVGFLQVSYAGASLRWLVIYDYTFVSNNLYHVEIHYHGLDVEPSVYINGVLLTAYITAPYQAAKTTTYDKLFISTDSNNRLYSHVYGFRFNDHYYPCNEESGNTTYDWGTATEKWNLTIINANLSTFHTSIPTADNPANTQGYAIDQTTGAIKPVSQAVTGDTVYNGRVKLNAEISNSWCALFDGTAKMSFASLTGITITTFTGTATPTISGNDITFTSGYGYYLELSNGSKYTLSEGGGNIVHDKVNGLHATIVNANLSTFWSPTSPVPYNMLNGYTPALKRTTGEYQISAESNQAYGLWQIRIPKNFTSQYPFFVFVANDNSPHTSGVASRYNLSFTSSGLIGLNKNYSTSIMYTADGVLQPNVDYMFRIVRGLNGSFALWIKGGSYSDWSKIPVTSGTNPAIDNTYTACTHHLIRYVSGFETSHYYRNVNHVMMSGDSTVADYNGEMGIYQYLMPYGYVGNNISYPADTIAQQLTKWNNYPSKQLLKAVILQIGLNDFNLSTDQIIAQYQAFILQIKADSPLSVVVASKCLRAKQRYIDILDEESGLIAFNKIEALNASLSSMSGVDVVNSYHVDILSDSDGNLKPEYDKGDHIHPNASGRIVIATGIAQALSAYNLNKLQYVDITAFNGVNSTELKTLYIPAKEGGSIDVLDFPLANPAGNYHNGAESVVKFPTAPELVNADTENYYFNVDGTAKSKTASDFIATPVVADYIFINVYNPIQIKSWLMYSQDITGDCYVKTMKYTKNYPVSALAQELAGDL